ncbi:MAG: thermonuclease family protein [Candidatus Nanoarchaeia archaeon]
MEKRGIVFLMVLVVLVVFAFYYKPFAIGKTISEASREKAFVLDVIDGDTIKTDMGTVRLLGVNTPEKSKPYYNEAKAFLEEFENKSVELLSDKEDKDKYNRKLRYVFYEGRLINAEILQNGFANTFMLEDLNYKDKLEKAQEYAIKNKIGIWEESKEKCSECITLKELEQDLEYFILKNECDFQCDISSWTIKDDANHFFEVDNIQPGEQLKISSKENVWNNEGDSFFMRDGKGKLVIYYHY